jgi:hypothetical protein
MLRTITGARRLEVVDGHTVRITDVSEAVDLARTVIEMAERPSEVAEQVTPRALADGSEIVCVHIRTASVPDVMLALRKEIGVKRIAANTKPSMVMLRDTPARIASALELIRQMEAPQD